MFFLRIIGCDKFVNKINKFWVNIQSRMKTKGNLQFTPKIDLQIYTFLAGIAALYLAMYVSWSVGQSVCQ